MLALIAAFLLVPSAAVAQAPQERIDAALAQAQEVGIPTALLESKMAEGRAKGVPMDRIAMAVENRLQGLTRALEVMSRGTDQLDAAQLSVGADALASGVDPETLVELVQSAPRERLLVAVAALGHLVERGLPVDQAVEAVNQALAQGPGGFAGIPGFAGPPADLPVSPVGPGGKGPGGDGPQVGPPGSVPPPGQVPDLPRPPGKGPPGGGF
jgi:hypothetical protein